MKPLYIAIALFLIAPHPLRAGYDYQNAFPSLSFTFPVDIQNAGDGSNRLFVVEKGGLVWAFDNSSSATTRRVFLDIQSLVENYGEAGLLGLAFHPQYASNGTLFVYYVTPLPYRSIVAQYTVSADPDSVDPSTESIVLDIPRTNLFHNGGQVSFGPDGMLYISIGDDTQQANAQDRSTLPGSILRIDIDSATLPMPYSIPPDNPYVGNALGYREEIYAYGLRNPWRISFDMPENRLWISDVGQDTYEEVNIGVAGANYGWPLLEGPGCYSPPSCDTTGAVLTPPVHYYNHSLGIAIIGGAVYRGSVAPSLLGRYIFGDYTGRRMWALSYTPSGPPYVTELIDDAPQLLAFGAGEDNELYFSANNGTIYRFATPTGINGAVPAYRSQLLANYPNPFHPSTTIPYTLVTGGNVTVEIADVSGRVVRRLSGGARGPGSYAVVWDGRTRTGEAAASGVYFSRLRVAGTVVDARRITLIK